jgi:hypothetical protein
LSANTLSLAITVVDTPVAQLVVSGSTLTASPSGAGYTYQWFLNDQLISGETGSTIQASAEGIYKVIVSSPQFCNSTAIAGYFVGTGITNLALAGVTIYPNPATNVLYINTNPDMAGAILKITTTDGRTVLGSVISAAQNTVNLPDMPAGIYLVNLQKGSTQLHHKFIKL